MNPTSVIFILLSIAGILGCGMFYDLQWQGMFWACAIVSAICLYVARDLLD